MNDFRSEGSFWSVDGVNRLTVSCSTHTRAKRRIFVHWSWITARLDMLLRDIVVLVVWLGFKAAQEGLLINYQVHRACAVGGKLTEDDVFCDTRQSVMLSEKGGLEQDFSSFFETALAKRSAVDSVDTMACD